MDYCEILKSYTVGIDSIRGKKTNDISRHWRKFRVSPIDRWRKNKSRTGDEKSSPKFMREKISSRRQKYLLAGCCKSLFSHCPQRRFEPLDLYVSSLCPRADAWERGGGESGGHFNKICGGKIFARKSPRNSIYIRHTLQVQDRNTYNINNLSPLMASGRNRLLQSKVTLPIFILWFLLKSDWS